MRYEPLLQTVRLTEKRPLRNAINTVENYESTVRCEVQPQSLGPQTVRQREERSVRVEATKWFINLVQYPGT